MSRKRKNVYSGIGGQAVLEGVMMKNKDEYAVAVRLPDGTVDVRKWDIDKKNDTVLKKIPFVRGVFNFIESMVIGMKTLTYSASFYEEEDSAKQANTTAKTKASERIEEKRKKEREEKNEGAAMGATVFVSLLIAIFLFMLVPYFIAEFSRGFIQNDSAIAIIEGVARMLIFLGYVIAISFMKDIRRLYQYHGAEHKCINCIENGRPLTVRNVMRCSRQHRRCGTSFTLIVMIISIVLFFFIRVETIWLRVGFRLLLIPVIAGISYEFLRLAGRYDNWFVRLISAPGLWLQLITTREPDADMVEVAIASVEMVFDWEAFEEKHFTRRMVKKTKALEDGTVIETGEETMEISIIDIEKALKESEEPKAKS